MTFKMALLEILPVAMWRHTGMRGGWVKKCSVGKNKVAPSFLLVVTILDRIKWNSKPPSPPQIKDEAKTRHFPILDLWGRGVQFPIYFVQDCSYFDFFTYFPISSQGSRASLRATPLVVTDGDAVHCDVRLNVSLRPSSVLSACSAQSGERQSAEREFAGSNPGWGNTQETSARRQTLRVFI